MSMEKAMAALNAANTSAPAAQVSEMPTNMANGGANIEQEKAQVTQEVKENATTDLKTGENDGVVDATKSAAEATTSSTEQKIEEAAPKKEEGPISAKFAALAKKEKALVKQQNEIKAREAAFAAREAEIAAKEAQIKESEAMWEKDVLKALEMKGLSYQKLTDMILKGEIVPEKKVEDPVEIAKKVAEDLRKEFAEKEAVREAAAAKARADEEAKKAKELEDAYNTYREEVSNFTKENSDEYELINMYGQQELIIETVQSYYEAHKRVLSVKEASDMVEKYLYDEAQKALKSKKLGGKKEETPTKKATVADAVLKSDAKVSSNNQTKTLTNNLTPTMSSVLPAATDAERMRRALDKLNSSGR